MLEKPDLQDECIITRLWEAYRLEIARVEFLPLGADYNTAVYRVETRESAPYFLKLRKGIFEETSVLVPQFLYDRGIQQIIPPIKTNDGRLWTGLDAYTCILYPFIKGSSGFELALSNSQWGQFGSALKSIHSAALPPELQKQIPSETFSSYWRARVKGFQAQVERSTYDDPTAAKMAAFMRVHRDEIHHVVERAGKLGRILQSQTLEQVLCHSDIHAGNLLLAENHDLYIVDWDNPIQAPKERDLMFIGGGVGDIWNSTREIALFYQGYGAEEINLTALTYYRYERIVQDIAAYCEEILLTAEGGDDREQGFYYFSSQFLPNGVIDIARQTEQVLNDG